MKNIIIKQVRFIITACALAAAPSYGEDTASPEADGIAADIIQLSGQEIKDMLTEATALYLESNARQFFAEGGSTKYVTHKGTPSTGKWWLADEKYCSSWGPSKSCYVVTRHTDDEGRSIIRWSGSFDSVIEKGNLLSADAEVFGG